jgi:hypothetical protein
MFPAADRHPSLALVAGGAAVPPMRREISRLAVRSGPRNRSVSCLAVYSALGTATLTPADVCGPKVRLMRYRPLLIQIVADRIRFCWPFPRPRARPGKGEGDVENGGPWPGLAALDEPVIDAHLPIRPYSPGNQMSTDGRSFTWCLVRLRWIRRVPILATAPIGIATSLRPHPCPFWRSTWVTWRPPGSTINPSTSPISPSVAQTVNSRRMSTSPAGTESTVTFSGACGRPGSRPVRAPDPPAPKTPGDIGMMFTLGGSRELWGPVGSRSGTTSVSWAGRSAWNSAKVQRSRT